MGLLAPLPVSPFVFLIVWHYIHRLGLPFSSSPLVVRCPCRFGYHCPFPSCPHIVVILIVVFLCCCCCCPLLLFLSSWLPFFFVVMPSPSSPCQLLVSTPRAGTCSSGM